MSEENKSEENKQLPKVPNTQKITIDLPQSLNAIYANLAFISHTPAEMIFDFAQVLPRSAKGKVLSRVIMSPMHAKLLHRALGQNIATFERQYGEIRFPHTLADELFNFSPPPSPTDDEDKG